jgi:hypothetical protein
MTPSPRQYLSLVVVALVFALGVAAVFAGEADDSPGLGGIGLIVAGVALWRGWVILRRR